jgi:circadian clock protein KaiC
MTSTGSEDIRQTSIQKSLTGIEGFDKITYGGLPCHRTSLIIGGPGAGKTVFALQALVNGASIYSEPAIFVAFEESADQIIHNAGTFGWNLEDLERERLFFLDARISPATVSAGQFDLQAILAGLSLKVEEMNAKRIVFDGLDVLLNLLDNEAAERREAYRLHEWLKETGLTGIITAKSDQRERLLSERYGFMQFMVDCVVGLQHKMQDRVSLRSLRVLKYRGSSFDEGEFPLVITEDGIEIATFSTEQIDFNVSTERVSTGIDRLDHMLDGGYYRGSSVIITGVPGTTKTTLAGTFADRMCRNGERVLLVSFDESGAQIVRNLKSVGIDLQQLIDDGTLRIHAIRTEARSAEEHFIELKRLIGEFGARHLVLDPVSALLKTGGQVSAMHAAFRILDYAKCRGITTICTSLVGTNETPDISTNMDISTIADTWIHLAYKVLGGERNRTLGIVKSRGTAHSNQVRELTVSRNGLDLKDVYTAGGEVLVGTARYEKEAANRSIQRRRELELQLRRAQLDAVQAELAARIEALRREMDAKQTEVALFEADAQASVLGDADFDSDVRRLRSADDRSVR